MKPVKVIPPGARVTIARPGDDGHGFDGTVVAVELRLAAAGVAAATYLVAWWGGETRHCEWLEAFEVGTTART